MRASIYSNSHTSDRSLDKSMALSHSNAKAQTLARKLAPPKSKAVIKVLTFLSFHSLVISYLCLCSYVLECLCACVTIVCVRARVWMCVLVRLFLYDIIETKKADGASQGANVILV